MKRSISRKLFLGITASIILISCKKNSEDHSANVNAQHMAQKYNYSDFPTVSSNRTMVFRDDAHLYKYIAFLDTAVDSRDPDDSLIGEHEILQDIESSQGFISLRSIAHANYERQDAIGWPSISAIPDEHFIPSNDIKSVLNANLDVQIGGDILHYINKNYAVRYDVRRTDLATSFNGLGSSASLVDVMRIDPLRQGSAVIELTGNGRVFDKGSEPQPLGTEFVVPPSWSTPQGCTNPTYVEFKGLALRNASSFLHGSFSINYNDGVIEQKASVLTVNGWAVPTFYHTFNSIGPKIVTITGYYNSNYTGIVETRNVNINIVDGSLCAISYKESGWKYGYYTPTEAWGGNLVMQHVGNTTRVVAYTKLVNQDGNGNWHGFKGSMYTSLSCYAKDNNCNVVDHLVGDVADTKKKDHNVHRTGQNAYKWTTSTSSHVYKKNGNNTLNITLTSCP